MKESYELRDLLNEALDSFKTDHLNMPDDLATMTLQERHDLYDLLESDNPHDNIFECTDSSVPVYTGDLMHYAANNIDMATNEPELGPAFDGSPTPVNIIAANIFEAIEQYLFSWWGDNREDLMTKLEELGIDEDEEDENE